MLRNRICQVLAGALFIAPYFQCSGQAFTNRPSSVPTATFYTSGSTRLELSHNGREEIVKEMSDTNLVRSLGRSAGLTEAEIASVRIIPNNNGNSFSVLQVSKSVKAFNVMSRRMLAYLEARHQGHTKEYLFAAITNNVRPLAIADVDLRILFLNRDWIVPSRAVRTDSGTQTNKSGQIPGVRSTMINGQLHIIPVTNRPASDEVCRWVSYRITDGEISWIYILNFKPNGRLDWIYDDRHDAKEDDPKYQSAIRSVDAEVAAEMKAKGTFDKVGAIHEFWDLKKKKLQVKGIDWRTPAELNPDVVYD